MNGIKRVMTIAFGFLFTISLTALQPSSSSSSSPSHSASLNPTPRFMRTALLLEGGSNENAYCRKTALLTNMQIILMEGACPIIVNAPTLHAFFYKARNLSQSTLSDTQDSLSAEEYLRVIQKKEKLKIEELYLNRKQKDDQKKEDILNSDIANLKQIIEQIKIKNEAAIAEFQKAKREYSPFEHDVIKSRMLLLAASEKNNKKSTEKAENIKKYEAQLNQALAELDQAQERFRPAQEKFAPIQQELDSAQKELDILVDKQFSAREEVIRDKEAKSSLISQMTEQGDLRSKVATDSQKEREEKSLRALKTEWNIYKHAGSTLYLLIPHVFIKKQTEAWNTYPPQENLQPFLTKLGISEQELILGFKIDHTDIMQKIPFEALIKELSILYGSAHAKMLATNYYARRLPSRWNKKISSQSIKQLFVSSEKTVSPLLGVWDIFINGHGGYSGERYVKAFPLPNQDPYTAIAGLSIDTFTELLTFFCNAINTASIYYATCYGGGHHQKIIAQHLNQSPHKMYGPIIISSVLIDVPIVLDATSFAQYFNAMEKILQPIIEKSSSSKMFGTDIQAQGADIAKATDYLNSGYFEQIEATPSLYLRGWKSWQLLDPQNKILIIDAALNSSKRTIDVMENRRGVLLTIPHITTPIHISTNLPCDSKFYPIFISQLPGDAQHTIDEIIIDEPCALNTFIKKSLRALKYPYTKKFIFKKIKGLIPPKSTAPVEIENLEVSTDGPMRYTANGRTFSSVNTAKACETCVEEYDDTPFEWVEVDTQSK